MKKLITLLFLIVSLIAVSTSISFAEEVDLSSYSDNELLTLLGWVQGEIVARHIEKTAQLPTGTYVGGKDIPVGTYVLTAAGAEKEYGIVYLRSVNDADDDWPFKLYEFNKAEEHRSFYITIDDGDMLALPFAYTLTISGGVMFK